MTLEKLYYKSYDPEYRKEYSRKYREENAERIKEKKATHYLENKDQLNARRKLNYQKNQVQILAQIKKSNDSNPEISIFRNSKHRAKRDNIPFNIEQSDIIIPEICPVLNIPIIRGNGKFTHNSPSVDRLIPELGYIKGNVRVISFRANLLKSDAQIWELEAVLKDLKNVRG